MYRDGTLEELIKDLEEERASKRLRELDPDLLIKPDIWIITPEEGACEKCKSFAKKLFLKNHNVLIQTANVRLKKFRWMKKSAIVQNSFNKSMKCLIKLISCGKL